MLSRFYRILNFNFITIHIIHKIAAWPKDSIFKRFLKDYNKILKNSNNNHKFFRNI